MFPLVACPVSPLATPSLLGRAGVGLCERWGECLRNAWRTLMKIFMKIFYFFFVCLFFLKYICRMDVNMLLFSSLCGFPVVREFD